MSDSEWGKKSNQVAPWIPENPTSYSSISQTESNKEIDVLKKKLSFFLRRKIDKEMVNDLYEHVRGIALTHLAANRKLIEDRVMMNANIQGKKDLVVHRAIIKEIEASLLREAQIHAEEFINQLLSSKSSMGSEEMRRIREIEDRLANGELLPATAERQIRSVSKWTEKYEAAMDNMVEKLLINSDAIMARVTELLGKDIG